MLRADDPAAPAVTRLTASGEVAFLEHFRTPYEIDSHGARAGISHVGPTDGPSLSWPTAAPDAALVSARLERRLGEPVTLFAPLLGDADAAALLGADWERVRAVNALDGERLASVWRDPQGNIFLPFDPDLAVRSLLSERYATLTQPSHGARRAAMAWYYRIRPLLPRRIQIALRRAFARIQARAPFPRWPVEPALHDLLDVLGAILAEVSGCPLPCIATWPEGYDWALVLTHDVEMSSGYAHVRAVAELEQVHGVRSAFNFVPQRYPLDVAELRALGSDGFEIGVHGLLHDGRDLESLQTLRERLPRMRAAAELWGATGFRSPATHRQWDWMPLLGFGHDSSSPDTDPFEPQAGGCCSWVPFFNRDLVELPLTLPQDHTLFVILRQDEQAWIDKAAFLRERGGMALIDTHPDYMLDDRVMNGYARFLARYAPDETAWKALPREVADWWRHRAASRLDWSDGTWVVAGPAAGVGCPTFLEGSW